MWDDNSTVLDEEFYPVNYSTFKPEERKSEWRLSERKIIPKFQTSTTLIIKAHPHSKYRSRIDIACAILYAAIDGGAIKSRLSSKAYVSNPHISDYLGMLIENGMLYRDEQTRKYHTTEKGQKLLEMYAEVRQIFHHR